MADAHGDPWTAAEAGAKGPFAIRSFDRTFVDDTRVVPPHGRSAGTRERTLKTTVWFPESSASSPVPADGFPIVLYSHGFGSSRNENPGLAEHLASHGFVVIAPTFPGSTLLAPGGPNGLDAPNQPRDLSFVLDRLLAQSGDPTHPLHHRLDPSRVAAVGLSMGGLTTLLVTFHPTLRDPRIDVAVAVAPASAIFTRRFYETTSTPVLTLYGDQDAILAFDPNATTFAREVDRPGALITVRGGTHAGFTAQARALGLLSSNVDSIACTSFESILAFDANAWEAGLVEPLGGAAAGVVPPPPAPFCTGEYPPAMEPTRQLAIENQVVLTTLLAHLATDSTTRERACHLLAEARTIDEAIVRER